MSSVLHHRGRVAALSRSRTQDDVELIEAKRELIASRLEDFIARTVDSAPPLTIKQRERLAALLHPAPSANGGGQHGAA